LELSIYITADYKRTETKSLNLNQTKISKKKIKNFGRNVASLRVEKMRGKFE
jgi:hypothetical protein